MIEKEKREGEDGAPDGLKNPSGRMRRGGGRKIWLSEWTDRCDGSLRGVGKMTEPDLDLTKIIPFLETVLLSDSDSISSQ